MAGWRCEYELTTMDCCIRGISRRALESGMNVNIRDGRWSALCREKGRHEFIRGCWRELVLLPSRMSVRIFESCQIYTVDEFITAITSMS